jgi:site-specific DNA-methyltransferase (adenine-specific)
VNNLVFKHQEGLEFLESIPDNSVDLILTDPPYITSRDSGMDKWVEHTERQDSEGAEDVKTEEDWEKYKTPEQWDAWFDKSKVSEKNRPKKLASMRKDFLKYGSIYGKKYAVTTNYGKWDSEFTVEKLDLFVKHFHRILRDGGTCIIFFDLWKLTNLKDILQGSKFKQLRFIEWIKTNPQPINSKVNYLTNCREIALLGIKKSKPTFNSKYDNAIYEEDEPDEEGELYKYPLQGGKERFHPTQKSLPLFEALINKHSNEGDLVLDCFAGSATTGVAALKTNRRFIGCELDKEYYEKASKRLEKYQV